MDDGSTIFNFIDERVTISSTDDYKWGVGTVDKELVFGHMDMLPNLRDFVSGYPPLIDDNQVLPITFAKEIDYNARRTAIGYNSTTVFILTVNEPGCRFAVMQEILAKLKCQYAVNLDGGGSTRLLVDGKLQSDNIWSRPVDNVVAFYLQEADPVLYRVQVGAFVVKQYADNMRAKIIGLEDKIGAGYINAYVRLIDNYYKVQIGAFSVKSNADKVVSDLAKYNIECFITTK